MLKNKKGMQILSKIKKEFYLIVYSAAFVLTRTKNGIYTAQKCSWN